MTSFVVGGRTIDLPAVPCAREASKDAGAWTNGEWATVRLMGCVEALRVHTDGRRIDARGVDPSRASGSWILIGDGVHTSSQVVQGRALPGLFTHVSGVEVLPGTVLNIGTCGPLFGQPGGGWQAEHVSGPWPRFSHLPNVWMNRSGSA